MRQIREAMPGAAALYVLLALSLAACSPSLANKAPGPGGEMSRAVIDPYLKIQKSLAFKRQHRRLSANAGNIATAATGLGAPAMEDRHDGSAAGVGRRPCGCTGKIRSAQRGHRHLHDGLAAPSTGGCQVAFCPMVKKPWLQEGRDSRQSLLRQRDADLRQLQELKIPFTKHTLDNGLDVLLHEDRSCPIVAVNLWYHVGSKNERPGHTGFAHLFEHLMFEGSEHYNRGYFQPLQAAGAALNGSTNADRTNYWEVVPSNALELALWMESDRMGICFRH